MSEANTGQLHRLVRRTPIDFAHIAEQTGLRRGKLCKTTFGWGVQNVHGDDGPNIALIDPPPLEGEETELRIENNHWCFYAPNNCGVGSEHSQSHMDLEIS
jgi:hypothetical protein